MARCHLFPRQHDLGSPHNKGRAPEFLALIDEARAEGVDVALDTYLYLAGNTYLSSILSPAWAQAGDTDAVLARLG